MTAELFRRYVGVLALILAIAAVVFGFFQQTERSHEVSRQAAVSSCQTRINQEFLAVLKERATIGNENTTNINDFVVAILNSKGNTAAQNAKIVNTYLTGLAKINGELQHATYPDIGSC
jgi:aminoglycoside phosphotransferase family enzyme